MSSQALVFPPQYNAARKWLFLHGVYGVVGGLSGCLYPRFTIGLMDPMLKIIDKFTGLPHFYPNTIEEHRLLVHALAFAVGIGAIYLAYSGPLWNRGGKALVEGSIWTRLAYIASAYALCFLTRFGSSLLFATASIDVLSVLIMKSAIGASWRDLTRGQAKMVSVAFKTR